jgi:hypothetical protein
MSSERNDFAATLFSENPPHNFAYNLNNQQFSVGEATIDLRDFYEYKLSAREPITYEDAQSLINESKLVIDCIKRVHMMPSLNRWLLQLDAENEQALFETTTQAMIDAYAEVGELSKNRLLKGNLWGFGAGLIRAGQFNLNVVGNCACYGVGLYGMFGQESWPDGYASLEPHNVDTPAQQTALLAGAGTVAYVCASDQI